MKKNFTLFAVLALALAGCAKEASVQDTFTPAETNAAGKVVYTLTANLPETKVTAARNGVFAWEGNETIAVWDEVSGKFIEFNNSAAERSTFTATLDEGTAYNFSIAYYPAKLASAKDKVAFPNQYNDSYSPLKKTTPIFAAKVDGTSLSFAQLGALVHITINDLPSITNLISVSGSSIAGICTINTENLTISSVSDTHGTVDIYDPVDKDFYLPIIPGADKKFSITVRGGDNIMLFSNAGTKNYTLAQNDLINMKPISINPTVYFRSDLTEWDNNTKAMVNSDGKASITVTALRDQYFRVCLVYPTDEVVEMGPASNVHDVTTSGAMNTIVTSWTDKTAVKICSEVKSNIITYDYTTGNYSITPSSPTLYAVGVLNSWDGTDLSAPLSNSGDWYYILGVKDAFKINYSLMQTGQWKGTFGKNPAYPTSGSPILNSTTNFGEANKYSSVLYNGSTNTYYCWDDGDDNTETYSNLFIKGNWDDWSTPIPMTQSSNNPHIWTIIHAFEANAEFKVTDNSEAWWGFSSNMEVIYDNIVWVEKDNLKVTVAGTYLIMFNDKTNKYHIVKVD